jgi:hypothetical protein
MRSKYERQRECEQVNRILQADAKRQTLGTKASQRRMDDARQHDSNAFSYWAQLEFREFIRRELEHRDTISASHLIRSGAYLLRISPITTKRYLFALTSQQGPFMQYGELVMLNPDYTATESYWQDEEQEAE